MPTHQYHNNPERPFASAVREAVRADTDCWEGIFYQNSGFSVPAQKVYMHSREIALGFEWSELIRCIVSIEGPFTRIESEKNKLCREVLCSKK